MTMYTKETIDDFKIDTMCNLEKWAVCKIDALVQNHPNLKVASTYMKRGIHNWIGREENKIDRILSDLMLFIADKDGNINTDVIIDDMMEMFKSMEKQQVRIGALLVEYGKGEVCITVPHSPWLDLFLGDLGHVRITTDDILEIKDMYNGKTAE